MLLWASMAIGVGISFLRAPFVVHTLGNTEYGIWLLLASLSGHMGLLDLGVQSAVLGTRPRMFWTRACLRPFAAMLPFAPTYAVERL